MRTRAYGTAGPPVVVLHGGPGAPGYMAPVARALADDFQVLEPWQRSAGGAPLTVAGHVADLDQAIAEHFPGERPALVGSSWGAMLALCYAAAHPDRSGPLVLIGCGTFDRDSRGRLREDLERRMGPDLSRRIGALVAEFPDPDERLAEMNRLLAPVYSHDLMTTELEVAEYDARGHAESWADMERLQAEGTYPAAFRAIEGPVLMLHGAADPHPGPMIRDSLKPHLPQLEYVEWKRCGHYPWLERAVADRFFTVLRTWLDRHRAQPERSEGQE